MIVSCPQCDARYELDPQVLSPDGRRVRWATCGPQWTERPLDESPGFAGPLDDFDEVADDEEFRATRQVVRPGRRRKKKSNASAAWLALAAAIAVIVVGAVVARNEVVSFWEPAARVYEAVGLDVNITDFGLDVQVTSLRQRRNEDNEIVIDVTGEILNTSSDVKPVPELEGALLDVRQRPIHSWRFNAATVELNPGEATEFKTSVVNPPDGAREVFVSFAVEG